MEKIDIRIVKNSVARADIMRALQRQDLISMVISSTDKLDRGDLFNIPIGDITIFDEDIKGLCIWWKLFNPLEGKYMTCSNHFKNYLFIYEQP